MTVTEVCKIKVTYEFPAAQQGNAQIEIGYRIQGSGSSYTTVVVLGDPSQNPYTFEQIVPCPTGCDAIVYEGYIKGCDDVEIPWVVTFTNVNVENCYTADWMCDNVGVYLANASGGTNYQVGDTVSFQGGGGSGATGIITTVNAITGGLSTNSITITNQGTGYTGIPTATIASSQGAGATVQVILADCVGIAKGFCNGDPSGNRIVTLPLGESFTECISAPDYATKYAALTQAEKDTFITQLNETNCSCADCKKVTVENLTAKSVIIMYNTCDATGQVPAGLPAGSLVFKTLLQQEIWTSPCHLLCETVTTNDGNQIGTVLNLTGCSDCS